jgi:hypothetical protein
MVHAEQTFTLAYFGASISCDGEYSFLIIIMIVPSEINRFETNNKLIRRDFLTKKYSLRQLFGLNIFLVNQRSITFFTFSFIIEAQLKKYHNLKCHCNLFTIKSFVLNKQKCIFEHCRKAKIFKITILFIEKFVLFTCSELPSISIFLYNGSLKVTVLMLSIRTVIKRLLRKQALVHVQKDYCF